MTFVSVKDTCGALAKVAVLLEILLIVVTKSIKISALETVVAT